MKLIQALVLLAGYATSVHSQTYSFGLFGDTPYTSWERRLLPELIDEMDRESLVFVIHDGDIKSGGSRCDDAVFEDILDAFNASRTPLVFVPGDNEWTDCHRQSNGGYDPLERLTTLRRIFFGSDRALGKGILRLERQSSDPMFSAYRENVRWEAPGVLFLGLNVPGSNNNFNGVRDSGPSAEYLDRTKATSAWLQQGFALAQRRNLAGIVIVIQGNPGFQAARAGKPAKGYGAFLEQLSRETRNFPGQVVLVHGDTHHQRIDQPLDDPDTGETLRNFTRIETHGSPSMGWTKVIVDVAGPKLFRFDPRAFPQQKLQ